MLLSDGVVEFYTLQNVSEKGNMPKEKLVLAFEDYFGYKTVGTVRYYQAKQANNRIDALIETNYDADLDTKYYAIIDNNQYKITQVQMVIVNGLRMMDVSLERLDEFYDI